MRRGHAGVLDRLLEGGDLRRRRLARDAGVLRAGAGEDIRVDRLDAGGLGLREGGGEVRVDLAAGAAGLLVAADDGLAVRLGRAGPEGRGLRARDVEALDSRPPTSTCHAALYVAGAGTVPSHVRAGAAVGSGLANTGAGWSRAAVQNQ